MKEERMTVEKSRCINCKYCECREGKAPRYFCIAKSERGRMLNSYRTLLREAYGRDFPYFCPLPENRKIIEDDVARRKDQHENRLINRVDTCARDLVFALMEADIVKTKWEPAMELHGKKYRLEWSVIEEAE